MLPSLNIYKTKIVPDSYRVEFSLDGTMVDAYYNSRSGEFEYGATGVMAPLVIIGGVAFFAEKRN